MRSRAACTIAIAMFTCMAAWQVDARTSPRAAGDAVASVDAYEGDSNWRVRPWTRRPVDAVTVTGSGLGDDVRDTVSEPESCASFRPTARQIRRFVAKARRVSQVGFVHDTEWSACHATGRLHLRGGADATWMVRRGGAGSLTIDGSRYYFDCPNCVLGDVAPSRP